MSSRRQRERPRARRVAPFVVVQPIVRRDRVVETADLTARECDRRHLEEVRPLLDFVVLVSREDASWMSSDFDAVLRAAVRIAGPCPAGWCRYPAGHTGDHDPLEAA